MRCAAVRCAAGYGGGEWDFALGESTITFKGREGGVSYTGTYVIGEPIPSSQ